MPAAWPPLNRECPCRTLCPAPRAPSWEHHRPCPRRGRAATPTRRAPPTALLQGLHLSTKNVTHTPPHSSVSPTKRKPAPTTTDQEHSRRVSPRRPIARANKSGTPFDTSRLQKDCLGALVSELADTLAKASSWEEFVSSFRGTSHLSSRLDEVDHPAAPLLRKWRDEGLGVPVLTSAEPWTAEQKDESVARGCHLSAKKHADFLQIGRAHV